MTLSHAVFYEPGHFHAALTLRTPNPRLAPDIHVYATPGPERQAFVTLVERFKQYLDSLRRKDSLRGAETAEISVYLGYYSASHFEGSAFNTRAEHPTHWRLHLHEGPELLQRLVEDGHGDFVVLAGRNNTKLETMASLTQAGLHVLADKPWLTDSRQLPYLVQVTASPRLAMDLMTVRHSLRAQLIAQVVHTPELFGTFVTQESTAPAIDIASVHHLSKRVNGRPLQRPAWYYDTTVQGDGVVDVQAHMVEQAQWWVLGDAEGDGARDIVLDSVRCWTTPVPLALFHESTGLNAYPEALQPAVRDGVLQYACNSEIRYRLRGGSVRQTAEWRQREPEGAGDLHRLTIRGSRCHVVVRQNEETGYQAMLHLVPAAGVALESMLSPLLAQWQEHFPGLASEPSSLGMCLRLPPALELGHEHQFALVLHRFLDHLDRGTWPQALPARIRMRYTLLAQAHDLGRRQRQGASP